MRFSLGKAESLSHDAGSIVVASDTLIVLDGEKIGKPRDEQDARHILTRLSGRFHEILTGAVVIGSTGHQTLNHLERIHVEMLPFSREDIENYLEVGESLDKAGAYSIQGLGNRLIAAIRGDYLAAVGLPLKAIADHLETLGINPPGDVSAIYREKSFRNWKDVKVLKN